KKITILLCFLSLLAFISCSNKKTTGDDVERTLSYYAGDWWGQTDANTGEEHIFTIKTDNSFTMISGGEGVEIPSSAITRNSGSSYTVATEGLTLTFSSDTQGKYTISQAGETASSFDITKK
ncbi:hypothetical protein, partial [Brachyspira catarrhinii]|uniref:hypothetical protein n=1 Tax=Brachyspira catarrhinii TaxID=2528966 RepID=UPI001386AC60